MYVQFIIKQSPGEAHPLYQTVWILENLCLKSQSYWIDWDKKKVQRLQGKTDWWEISEKLEFLVRFESEPEINTNIIAAGGFTSS